MSKAFSLYLFQEDGSSNAYCVSKALIRILAKLAVAGCKTHLVRCEPYDNSYRDRVTANAWRSTRPEHQTKNLELFRYIARLLAQEQFVIFFIDGDKAWSTKGKSLLTEQFDKRIRSNVAQLLKGKPNIDDLLSRLMVVMPYYSVESWLYQHTHVAVKLCNTHYNGRDVKLFSHWSKNRHELDEIPKIKEETCLRSDRNSELCGPGFPATAVYLVGKSFKTAVDHLQRCTHFTSALRKTC